MHGAKTFGDNNRADGSDQLSPLFSSSPLASSSLCEPDDITFDTMVDALENDSTEGCYEFADHFFSLGIRRGQYKDVYTGVDYGRYLEKEVAKSEEEEVGTPEGTLTASTSAAQLQELQQPHLCLKTKILGA